MLLLLHVAMLPLWRPGFRMRGLLKAGSRRLLKPPVVTQARAHSAAGYVQEIIEFWGRKQPTAVTLQELCEAGLQRKRRRKHGIFLHRELRIRFSRLILELQQSPHGLSKRAGIEMVIGWYVEHLLMLEEVPVPATAPMDEAFTNLLTQIFSAHSEVIQALAFGVHDLIAELEEGYKEVQPEVDAFLGRFFTARIGLRFLLQHHIESWENRTGHSGILRLDCSAYKVAKKAAEDSKMLCREHLGQAPEIVIRESVVCPEPFTYVPMHMHYILLEVFKNACRAVVENHADASAGTLPAVQCHIVHGHEDVTLKISDEGGGISRDRIDDVWKFMHSTYKQLAWDRLRPPQQGSHPTPAESSCNPLQRPEKCNQGASGSVLAGYGVGLTLSRLYSQYFGGDLRMMSQEGFGTDVYLSLNRLGNLPPAVLMREFNFSKADDDEKPRSVISRSLVSGGV